jgi:hypothetical protein
MRVQTGDVHWSETGRLASGRPVQEALFLRRNINYVIAIISIPKKKKINKKIKKN